MSSQQPPPQRSIPTATNRSNDVREPMYTPRHSR